MPSTYTQNLQLEKPGTGEQAGVWGITANRSYDEIDTATDGNLPITLSSTSYTLITSQTGPSEGHNKVILWNGTLNANATVNISPNTAKKLYLMSNNTQGGFPINFQMQAGTGGVFTLQAGYAAIIYADGAGSTGRVAGALANPQFANVLVTGNLTVNGSLAYTSPQTFTQPVTFNPPGPVSLNAPTTATALTINTAGYGAAPYDLYYRSPSGAVAPLAVGAAGQVLQVTGGGALGWATITLAIGASITSSVAYAIYFSSASNTFTQDSRITARAGVGIGLGLPFPSHTLHLGYNLVPEMWLDTNDPTSGNIRQILWATGGAARWNFYSPAEAETGGNVGSNLYLVAYNDPGAPIHGVVSFIRASGNVTIGAYGDYGARLAILNDNPGQPVLMVRGAAGQGYLQVWQNSAGQQVASIDASGNLISAGGQNYLSLTQPSGRLDIHGTVASHPLGTIHIGAEPGTTTGLNGVRSSIAMESAQGGTDGLPPNTIRIYHRNGYFMIQFYYNGQNFWASLGIQGQQGPAGWNISSSPPA